MQRFLFLMRFASGAIRTLKEAPERIAKIRQFVDDIHARCGFVPTSGKYDSPAAAVATCS